MFDSIVNQLLALAGENLLNLLAALGILVGGWVVARLVAWLIYRLMRRTNLDERLSGAISEADGDTPRFQLDRWVAGAGFYLVMLFVLIAFFQTLQLTAISGPLSALLDQLLLAAPQFIGALLILLLAWVIATLARGIVSRALKVTRFEERIASQAEISAEAPVSDSLAQGVFWLVFLLFLPAVLSMLGMQGLVEPVQGVVDTLLNGIPNLFGALVLLLVGWFIARIIRQIVTNLLVAANIDRFGQQVGLDNQNQKLSNLIGTVVYILILIPAVIAALNALNIEAISGPAIAMLTAVMTGIPAFFGALVVLAVAYFVGRLIAGLVTSLLTGIGFDRLPAALGLQIQPAEDRPTLSTMVGYLVMVAAILLAAIEAASLLGLTFLAEMLGSFAVFGGQAILALFIFAVGLYLANLARDLVLSAGGGQAAFTANLVRVAVLVFVAALALQQLGIASEIVTLAFGILLGTIGVATALAFGLGARDVAGEQVRQWRERMTGG